MTATTTWTDAERIAKQRETVNLHISLENAQQQDRVLEETFATEGVFYDVVPGVTHLEGLEGVAGFYEMLFAVLPDIHISISHEYDVPGCSVREGVVTGTHSAEFAGVPASGKPVSFAFCGLYLFGDDPTRLVAERAYWDNDGLIKQMRGEEVPTTEMPWGDPA
ncbi:ester cyclase [Pseudonocardia sp. RS010]|uniref:ester cyclase n=1 Tax=Pseudonocardia sp. RS010 TaxID=3385979 RepID=UPI0039A2B93F